LKNNKKVIIYTDGACSGNPGKGGWGAVLSYKGKTKEINGYNKYTTNNQMELQAVAEALKVLKRRCEIEVYTDSQYVKNGITKWIHGWKKNGWKNSKKQPVKNQEFWERLDEQVKRHNVEWHWVKGHADNELNNKADYLATSAITNHS